MLTILLPPTLGRVRASARARLLAEILERQLDMPASVQVAQSYTELEQRVLAQEVDLAWAPPSICSRAENKQWQILKAVRNGHSMYRSALICRKNDEFDILTLKAKRAAWVDPLSTGGHLLAISLLRKNGKDPSEVFTSQEFHGSYQAALLSLIRDQADVAAIYVYGTQIEDVRRALSEHVGASEVRLQGFAFTDQAPADGLINTGTSPDAGVFTALLLSKSRSRARTLLLELIDAQDLVLAQAGDYEAIRQALSPPKEPIAG